MLAMVLLTLHTHTSRRSNTLPNQRCISGAKKLSPNIPYFIVHRCDPTVVIAI